MKWTLTEDVNVRCVIFLVRLTVVMGSLRVGHDWVTSLSLSCIGEGNGNPVFLPGESQGRGSWWVAVYGVAQSQTRLKRLSSSSSSSSDARSGPNLSDSKTCFSCLLCSLELTIISVYSYLRKTRCHPSESLSILLSYWGKCEFIFTPLTPPNHAHVDRINFKIILTSTGQDFVQNVNHWMEQLCKLRGISHFLALEVFLNGHELAVREQDVVQKSPDI